MKTFLCMGMVETAVFAWIRLVRGHSIDWLCFIIIFVLGKWAKQQEKRMWKPWAWSKEATKTMSGFSKLFFLPHWLLLFCSLVLNQVWFKDTVLCCWGQESQLKDEHSKNEQLEKQTDLLRAKAELLDQASDELKIILQNINGFWQFDLSAIIVYLPTHSSSQKQWKTMTILKQKSSKIY